MLLSRFSIRKVSSQSKELFGYKPGRAVLEKGVVRIRGPDTVKFINGLCTSNINKWHTDAQTHGLYTAFLTPHVLSC